MNTQEPDCGVACKEWAGVRDALVDGRQTILIRKGGVSEGAGPGEFTLEHPAFWIYPTQLHEAEQGLKTQAEGGQASSSPPGTVLLSALARVHSATWLASERTLESLDAFHVLTHETIEKRFHYRRPGLWVILARVMVARPGFAIGIRPGDAGCKTWVSLERALPTEGLEPAMDEMAWHQTVSRLERVLAVTR